MSDITHFLGKFADDDVSKRILCAGEQLDQLVDVDTAIVEQLGVDCEITLYHGEVSIQAGAQSIAGLGLLIDDEGALAAAFPDGANIQVNYNKDAPQPRAMVVAMSRDAQRRVTGWAEVGSDVLMVSSDDISSDRENGLLMAARPNVSAALAEFALQTTERAIQSAQTVELEALLNRRKFDD